MDPPERETVFLSASARVVECNYFSETPAIVVQGHGIASGKNYDARFPQGTLAMQIPIFEKLGLNFSDFYQGTINLDVSPSAFKLGKPAFCFTKVDWSKDIPAEDFSFFPCRLEDSNSSVTGYIYWPHPSTKPGFYQPANVLEMIAPHMLTVKYGAKFNLVALYNSITFCLPDETP